MTQDSSSAGITETPKADNLYFERTAFPPSAPPPDRRRFLVASAAVGVSALASRKLFGPNLLRVQDAGPTSADWAALRHKLSTHDLSRPGDKSYPQARLLYDPRFDNLRPSGIAFCGKPADVGACLSFVRKFKLRFRIRTGGHSYAGWSSLDGGLVIDVTRISKFSVGKGTVTVGAGIDLINLYGELAKHGLAVPGGSCPTVGLAGLALGGGIGVLSRQFGLTCDAIEAVQIVTASGDVLNCDSRQHSDLYWASRGGGGGNFGVATAFTLRTHELRSLTTFFLQWPWSRASRVISAWQSWAPHGPHELWSNLILSTPFGHEPQIFVGGSWLGSVDGANRQLRSLYNRIGSGPMNPGNVTEKSYLTTMLDEANCHDHTVQQCTTKPGGVLGREPSFAKSDFFSDRLSAGAIRILIEAMNRASHLRGAAAGGVGAIAFDSLGGAVNEVHPRATAFVHRDALFDAQYSTSWNNPGSKSGTARQHEWLRNFYKELHPHANGQAYQNYIDPDLKNWRHAYYAENYPRLARIKGRYDPHNLFNFPQSITA